QGRAADVPGRAEDRLAAAPGAARARAAAGPRGAHGADAEDQEQRRVPAPGAEDHDEQLARERAQKAPQHRPRAPRAAGNHQASRGVARPGTLGCLSRAVPVHALARTTRASGDPARPPEPGVKMRNGIHPDYVVTTVTCSCGESFVTRS